MVPLLLSVLAVAQTGAMDPKDFPKEMQASALWATVRIVNAATSSTGSGVVVKRVGDDVYVLTAAHVVDQADKVEVHTFSAESYPKQAREYDSAVVLERSKELDLAVVRITMRDKLPGALPLCPKGKAPTDKDFVALTVGCNGGKAPTCLAETVNGRKLVKRPGEDEVISWEVATAPAKGRSGGPLVDKRGYVLGIASGANDGKGYFVHTEEIVKFLKERMLEDLLEEDKK
jgi:serine protease Do